MVGHGGAQLVPVVEGDRVVGIVTPGKSFACDAAAGTTAPAEEDGGAVGATWASRAG